MKSTRTTAWKSVIIGCGVFWGEAGDDVGIRELNIAILQLHFINF